MTLIKNKLFLTMLFVVMATAAFAQNFKPSDIDGRWRRSDGAKFDIKGTATFAEGSWTVIIDVGNSNWPQSAKSGYKFRNIKYVSYNTWKATSYSYNHNKNIWNDEGQVTLEMNADKNSFKAEGFTYTRM